MGEDKHSRSLLHLQKNRAERCVFVADHKSGRVDVVCFAAGRRVEVSAIGQIDLHYDCGKYVCLKEEYYYYYCIMHVVLILEQIKGIWLRDEDELKQFFIFLTELQANKTTTTTTTTTMTTPVNVNASQLVSNNSFC